MPRHVSSRCAVVREELATNIAKRCQCEGMPIQGQNEEPKVAQGDIDAHDDAPYAGEERAMQAPGLPEDARAAAAAGVRGGLIGGRDGRTEGPLIPGRPTTGYPLELRLKVLAAVDRGISRKEVVRTFGIAMPTLERYVRLRRPTGEIHPPRPPGRRPFVATAEERCALWRQLAENDDANLKRHCELWEIEQGKRISVPTMWRAVRRLGWKKKRGRWEPPEQMDGRRVPDEKA